MNQFQFLGFAAFHITCSDGTTILIDPYLDKNPVSPLKAADIKKLDLMLISHAAFDHIGEADVIAKNTGCAVICGGDSKLWLLERGVDPKQIIETVWGLTVRGAGIYVRPVESRHRSATFLKDGRQVTALPLGFMIDLPDGTRVYNASDTAIFGDMELLGKLQKPDIGLINATIENPFDFLPHYYTGEMTASEAALCAKMMNLDTAVACHYTVRDCEDIRIFLNELEGSPVRGVALNPGETLNYTKPTRRTVV